MYDYNKHIKILIGTYRFEYIINLLRNNSNIYYSEFILLNYFKQYYHF
jgi:hypothetical protein